MTRECTEDFKGIREYVDKYKISDNLRHPDYLQSLKVMHKVYFSAIAWSAELQHGAQHFFEGYPNSNEDIVFRLVEAVSDLGSSFFNWINGNYKASRVMLRVAIENFIRAVSGLENKLQIVEKSVYRVFDSASKTSLFDGTKHRFSLVCFNILRDAYKDLCADAHTATTQNMEKLNSLADFPAFNVNKAKATADIYIRVAKNVNSTFCIVFNTFFHQMHHRNKENILNGVVNESKGSIIAPSA